MGPTREERRLAVFGAVALPFFAMPLPLTMLAWDLYGGFAIHARILAGLVLLGALGGLGWPRARRAWTAARQAALWGLPPLLLFGLGGFLLARILGAAARNLVTRGQRAPHLLADWGPAAVAVVLLWLLATVRLGLRAAPDPRARAGSLALAWTLMAGAWAAFASGVASGEVAGLGALLSLAATAPGLEGRLAGRSRSVRALPVALGLGILGAVLGRSVTPNHHAVGLGLCSVVGVAGGGGLGWILGGREPRWRRTCLALGASLARRAPLLALVGTLALLALVASIAVEPVGEVFAWTLHLGPRLGPSGEQLVASHAGDPAPLLRAALRAVLAVVLVGWGVRVRSGAGLRRFLGLGLLTWGALVVLQVGHSVSSSPAVGGLRMLVLASALGPWLLRRRPESLRRLESLGLILAPVLLGPLVARYLAAAVPSLGDPEGLARIGAGVGLLLGALLARLDPPDQGGPWALLRVAALGLLSLGLIIYLAVFYALFAGRFVAAVAALTALVLGSRAARTRGLRVPRLRPLVALWCLFYLSFGAVVVFKGGPSPASCAAVIDRTSARVLLRRFEEGGDYASADPYDVLPDPSGRWLVATFKRFDARGGFVEVLDVDRPQRRSRLLTRPPDGRGPLWPERFALDPQSGRMYFGMLGIDHYSLWEVALDEVPGEVARLDVLRRVPLAFEPSYPAVDLRRRRLVQPYLSPGAITANRPGWRKPLVEGVDLGGLYSTGSYAIDADGTAMSEYVAVDQRTGRYYVPAYFNLVRFALLELDGDNQTLLHEVETFHPTIGLVVDEAAQRLYATNCVGGTVETWDLRTWELLASTPSGAFPRDVAYDAERGLLYVGNYSGGTVSIFQTRRDGAPTLPRRLEQVEVGPVLRGVGLDPRSGRAFAASACGIFEVTEAAGRGGSGGG